MKQRIASDSTSLGNPQLLQQDPGTIMIGMVLISLYSNR